ncbi:hypothetical protein ACFTQ7_24500 [Lysinibacillus sp. NPDC056959]|uniref:hypothetical protein n=1 Tax=Lysinibacillus sp. NPDC056959 TaxID=3345981 RepID=UPI003635A091
MVEESSYKSQIKKLRKKAEISRNAYFMLTNRFKFYSNLLHFFVLLGSTIVAILTFADYEVFLPLISNLTEPVYKLFIGLIASAVFVLAIMEEFLKLSKKTSEYESSGKQLTSFIRHADSIEKREEIQEGDLSQLTLYYTLICETTPIIPDNYFFKAKRHLYRKISLSKEIEDNPNMILWIENIKRKKNSLFSSLKKVDKKDGNSKE